MNSIHISLFVLLILATSTEASLGTGFRDWLKTTSTSCINFLGALFEKSASVPLGRVTEPVPGLYEHIPSNITELNSADWSFKISSDDPWITQVTYHHWSGDLSGSFEVYVIPSEENEKKYIVNLRSAYLDDARIIDGGEVIEIPSFISSPTLTSLTNRGVPLGATVIMSAMKRAGVTYGGMCKFEIESVQNLETILELAGLQKQWKAQHPGATLSTREQAKLIQATTIFKFARTIIEQSGHRITSVRVIGGQSASASYSIDNIRFFTTRRRRYLEEVVRQYNLTKTDHQMFRFNIEIEVSSL